MNGELTNARDLLLPLAEDSNAMAQFYLGVILGLEFYAESDPDLARSWILKAAEGSHSDAMIYICLNFLDDDPVVAEFVSRNREMMIEKMTQIAESRTFVGRGRSLADFRYIALANLAGLSSEVERLKYARIAHERIHPWGGPTLWADLLWDDVRQSGQSLGELHDERFEIMIAYMLDAYKGYPPAQFSLGRLVLEYVARSENELAGGWAWIIWSNRQGRDPATEYLKAGFDKVPERIRKAASKQLDKLSSEENADVRENRFQWCDMRFPSDTDKAEACIFAATWHHLACTLPREWHKPRTFWRTELYAMCREHMIASLSTRRVIAPSGTSEPAE